jgi:hypothetical protein
VLSKPRAAWDWNPARTKVTHRNWISCAGVIRSAPECARGCSCAAAFGHLRLRIRTDSNV